MSRTSILDTRIRQEVSLADAKCLADIAYGRSGDKGTSANVGILARSFSHYEWLVSWLTADRVHRFFRADWSHVCRTIRTAESWRTEFCHSRHSEAGLTQRCAGQGAAQALLSMPVNESSRVTS